MFIKDIFMMKISILLKNILMREPGYDNINLKQIINAHLFKKMKVKNTYLFHKHHLLFTLLVFVQTSFLFGQTPKENYLKAESYLNNVDFKKSIVYAEIAKSQLGITNPKTESLLMMAYFNNGDIVKAKIAYETLLKITPYSKQQSTEFQRYIDVGKQIDNALAKEQNTFLEEVKSKKRAGEKKAEEIEQAYEKDYNFKNTKLESKAKKQENAFYQKAKSSGNLESMKQALDEYVKTYPNSSKTYSAKEEIAVIKKEQFRIANQPNVWTKARASHTVSAYQNYLNIYPDGNYNADAEEYIYHIKADALYVKIQKSTDLGNYEYYYKYYKRGKNFTDIEKALANYSLTQANGASKRKSWYSAIKYYEDYSRYNHGIASSEIERKYKKAKRLARQDDYTIMGINYDKLSHGVWFASFNKDRLGFYLKYKGRTHQVFGNSLFEAPNFQTLDFEFPEDSDVYIEDLGSSTGQNRYTKLDDDDKNVNYIGIVGLTKKLVYPVWLNVGIGGGFYQIHQRTQLDRYRRHNGNFNFSWEPDDEIYVVDEGRTGFVGVFEIGVSCRILKKVFLSYGVTSGFDQSYSTFSLSTTL
jgi:hypothetical protein